MIKIFFAFLISSSSATELDPLSEVLTREIDSFNQSTNSNNLNCTHSGMRFYAEKPQDKFQIDFCTGLETYRQVKQPVSLNFTQSDPPHLCGNYWQDGVSPFLTNKEIIFNYAHLNQPKDKQASNKDGIVYTGPTRADANREGLIVGTATQIGALLEEAKTELKKMENLCCGEDIICKEALKKVEIDVCRDPKADRDPSLPDACYAYRSSYFYSFQNQDDDNRFMSLVEEAAAGTRQYERTYKFIKSQNSGWFSKKKSPSTNSPLAGKIVLSPYFVNSAPYSRHNIRHEIGHACSAIRRQQQILKKNSESSEVAEDWLDQASGECRISRLTGVAMQNVFKTISTSDRLFKCTLVLAQASTQKGSLGFVSKACPRQQIEEGYGYIFDMVANIKDGTIIPSLYPNRICTTRPSDHHPHQVELAKCLFLSEPALLQEAQDKLKCRM